MITDRMLPLAGRWTAEADRSARAAVRAVRPLSAVSLLSFSVTVGVGLFLLNSAAETLVGLPLAEFAFVGMLLLGSKATISRSSKALWVGLWLVVGALAALAATSDVRNGFGPFEMAKDATRLLLLFAPALLVLISARPRWFLGVALGIVLADSMTAGWDTAIALTTGADLQALKPIFPMPGILLICVVALRTRISMPLLFALSAGFMGTTIGALMSGSRNAIASMVIVGGIWAIGSLAPRVSRAAILIGGSMPWIPIVLVWTLPVVDFLFSADVATAGNLERSVSMLVGRGLIEQSPWTGTGLLAFSEALTYEMGAIAGLLAPALDPHNFYMQVGVAFGIPAMILVTVTVLAMFHWGFQVSSLVPWQRGACLLVLGWIAAITPLAGSSRLEWIVLWVILVGLPTSAEGDVVTTERRTSTRGRPFPVPGPLTPLAVRPAVTTAPTPDLLGNYKGGTCREASR